MSEGNQSVSVGQTNNHQFYFMNNAAFSSLKPYLNSSALLSRAEALEGKGVYEIAVNNSYSVYFPFCGVVAGKTKLTCNSPIGQGVVYQNSTVSFSPDTYYLIFGNNATNQINILYSVSLVQAPSAATLEGPFLLLGESIGTAIALLLGIALIVKGLTAKESN